MPRSSKSQSTTRQVSSPFVGAKRHTFGKATSSIFGNPADQVTVSVWGRVGRLFRTIGRRRNTSLGFFTQQVSKIGRLCLSQDLEPGHAHRQRVEALKRLEVLDRDITDSQLYQQDERILTWSTLVCVFHFQQQLRGQGCMECNRESRVERANYCYDNLIKRIVQDKPIQVIDAILSCISTGHYWKVEHVCTRVISKVTNYNIPCEMLLNPVLDHLEDEMKKADQEETRHVIRVLYEVLQTYTWPSMTSSAINAVLRLLELYRISTLPDKKKSYNNFSKIKKGLEVCATRIFDNMSNVDLLYVIANLAEWTLDPEVTDEAILDISSLLEYAAGKHSTDLLTDSLNKELFMTILAMVSSERRLVSLLGNRVLHYLLDRNKNRLQFDTPKIFFQNTHFNVVVGEYYSEDKNFLRQYRESIHDSFMRAFMIHGHNRLNLDACYTTICLLITEVPCGYTAASVVCLAMNIQSEALTDENVAQYPDQMPYHLHATVMSIMSLLCWVHRADEFYDYVNKVMNRRAGQAPHLNPPLRNLYSFAQHHVKWNKPDLFFEDWEIRYGLWKCFRTGEPQEGQQVSEDFE